MAAFLVASQWVVCKKCWPSPKVIFPSSSIPKAKEQDVQAFPLVWLFWLHFKMFPLCQVFTNKPKIPSRYTKFYSFQSTYKPISPTVSLDLMGKTVSYLILLLVLPSCIPFSPRVWSSHTKNLQSKFGVGLQVLTLTSFWMSSFSPSGLG